MMTLQEMYDKAATHLLLQGKRCAVSNANGFFSCRYRGPEGSMCAVGALIPDEMYDERYEGIAADNLLFKVPGLAQHLMGSTIGDDTLYHVARLLSNLQHIHDRTPPEDWKRQLDGLADRMNLKPLCETVKEMKK